MNNWHITSQLWQESGTSAIPTPKIIIDVLDSGWANANNFLQYSKFDNSWSVDIWRANDSVFIGVQRDISDRDKTEWLNHKPMIFIHTKRLNYPDRRMRSTRKHNSHEISHIANTPSWIIVWSGNRWNLIQCEPLNRPSKTSYGWWTISFYWFQSGWLVPTFNSELDFTQTKPWSYQIIKFNPFNFLSGLQNAQLPIRYVDAAYDWRFHFYMHNKRYRGVWEPHTKIPLLFTFAHIDPLDERNVIESDYSQVVYLGLKIQELERPDPNNPWERYCIDRYLSLDP